MRSCKENPMTSVTRRRFLNYVLAASAMPLAACETMTTSLQQEKPVVQAAKTGAAAKAAAPAAGGDIASLPPLREMAKRAGIYFGGAVRHTPLGNDPEYGKAVARECNIIVAENAFKWFMTQPMRGRWKYEKSDLIADFAAEHQMKLRGHTFVWYRQPKWVDDALAANPKDAEQLMRDHIMNLGGHYRGKVIAWDVVNEAIEPRYGRKDGLRKSPWLDALGPQYIDMAFRFAAEADPKAKLVYNDYGGEFYGKQSPAILELVRGMKKRGVPLHGVGIQAHLRTANAFDAAQLRRFCKEVKGMGLELHITELDITDKELPDDAALRDQKGADRTRQFFDTVLEEIKPTQILTWGLTDKHTWLGDNAKPGARRPSSLPLDANYQRKLMWRVLYDVLRQAGTASAGNKS
jgi:endo-1,4-beta-xylanase